MATGNDGCPLRVDLTWKPLCNLSFDPNCAQPQIQIQANFRYGPAQSGMMVFAFNMSKYSFGISRSAVPSLVSSSTTMGQICTYLGGSVDPQSGTCSPPGGGAVTLVINGNNNKVIETSPTSTTTTTTTTGQTTINGSSNTVTGTSTGTGTVNGSSNTLTMTSGTVNGSGNNVATTTTTSASQGTSQQ